MPDRKRRTRRIPPALAIMAVLIIGGAITYGVALAAGWLENDTTAQKPSREGKVKVPKSLVSLNAYEKVQREDVYNLELGDDSYFWLPQSQVEAHPEWIIRVDDIVGRVMARDKRSDFVFSEKDFLPKGSRSGIAGGIPVGKQGFFIDVETVPGLRFLKSGDRFDLLASVPPTDDEQATEYGVLMGGIKALAGKPIPLNGVRILAQNAQMIALTTNRNMTTQGGLNLDDENSRRSSNNKDERVAIAIAPEEAVPLTQALGAELDIYMVTRSGQDSAPDESVDQLKGLIPYPATSLSVQAFSRIQAKDLADPETGELRQYYFAPGDVEENWIIKPEQLIGRVVKRDIEPGYIFNEEDFLPPGSLTKSIKAFEPIHTEQLAGNAVSAWAGRIAARDLPAGTELSEEDLLPRGALPGFSSAIPQGLMALTLSTEDVYGANELARGSRCDLLSSAALDKKSTLVGVDLSPALASELDAMVVNVLLASSAIVIQQTESSVILAMRPEEVSATTKAIAGERVVHCVARTTQPGRPEPANPSSDVAVLESDEDPLAKLTITEEIIAGKRSAKAYRRTE